MTIEPNDPTQAGPHLPEGAAARLSQNEIRALCLKAARGAGMSWGLAEEAGFAAAWLSAHGLDGPGALRAWLDEAGGRWADCRPAVRNGRWTPAGRMPICPVALGTALCDFAGSPEVAPKRAGLRAGPVARPVLLLPFLATLAALEEGTVALGWGTAGRLRVDGAGRLAGDPDALAPVRRADIVLLRNVETVATARARLANRLRTPGDVLRDLDAYAMRTTVPPSEASRAGAGAVAGDND